MKLKICGITDRANLAELLKVGNEIDYLPDYLGFISYDKSQRYVSPSSVPDLLSEIQSSIKKVLVAVDMPKSKLEDYLYQNEFDAIQFHGNETESDIKEFKLSFPNIEIIKAIKVKSEEDLRSLEKYSDCVDLFLFDAAGESPGGNGVKFSWQLLDAYTLKNPFFLSGGIRLGDMEEIWTLVERLPRLIGIDVNSGFEDVPGVKNPNEIRSLLRSLKNELSS